MNSEIRLNPPSRWAMSIYSGNDSKNSKSQSLKKHDSSLSHSKSHSNKFHTPQILPYEGQGKNKYALYPTNLQDDGPLDADVEIALTGINSTDQVKLNFNRVLNTRKGDLAMIQREVFKCRPNIPHLEHIELILKRVECIDRRVYDLKVHESDTFMKYRKHPNFISLFSYWSEPTTNKYAYRNLIQLFEEGAYGDIGGTIMMSPVLPSTRILLKYLCDVAKALSSIHASNIIHAAVRPSNIYICQGNEAKLGEFKKVELDAARQTNQLSSKILIGQAIPKTLIYWAPELFSSDRYDTGIDMWALGITFYQIMTGEQPFSIINEEQFKSEVIHGKIRWLPLKQFPVFMEVIQNLLKVNPKERWTANRVMYFCQDFFAAEIQNAWRGYYKRREFRRISLALVKIQACIKGFLTRIHYQRDRVIARENAALMIQKKWRSHNVARSFKIARRALMRCQANVLARQSRRAYTKMKIDTVMAQAMIRRYLAMSWYHQLKKKRFELESDLENINSMISKYNQESQMFQNQFSTKKVGAPLTQFNNQGGQGQGQGRNYNDYEDEREYYGSPQKGVYNNRQQYGKNLNRDYEERKDQGDIMRNQKSYSRDRDGDDKTRRILELTRNSKPLSLQMQHAYSYNQWDTLYEPYNIVENVLKDNESIYKAMNPILDFTLHHGVMCFVGEIYVSSVEPGPGDIEIYVGKALDRWDLLTVHRCGRELEQRILFKQEVHAKYLRLKCVDNLRGGNLCCVRFVQVFGVPL